MTIIRGCMASNFSRPLVGSIPLTFGTKTHLGWLEVWKVENDLNFSSFTTVAYYIDFGGHAPREYWAWHWLTPIPKLGLPIGTTKKIFLLILPLSFIFGHPSTLPPKDKNRDYPAPSDGGTYRPTLPPKKEVPVRPQNLKAQNFARAKRAEKL